MSWWPRTLEDARTRVRDMLRTEAGMARPDWRAVVEGDSEDVNAVAPTCTSDDHAPEDAAALYSCCPGPVIETAGSVLLALYLAELLNADNANGDKS